MGFLDFDFSTLFTLTNLLVIIVGSLIGLLFGAIPGLGAMVTVVLMLPVSFLLPPLPAILLLLSIYQSSEYGGSISSIILGIPGTSSNVATILDGHPLAKKGNPGKALGFSLFASTIGGLVGGLVLVFLAKPVASFALTLSYPEYFLVALLGILAVAAISSTDMIKSIISAVLGLMAGTVGIDLLTGDQRFTFGRMELMDGFEMIPIIIGMFAFTEVVIMIRDNLKDKKSKEKISVKTGLTPKEYKSVMKPIGISSLIGSIVGIFPGTGSGTASWFGYSVSKKVSKNPKTFGKGNPEGLAGAESANNAAVGGAVLPLLTLGVPGSPTIAIIMGAFIIHGVIPGPHIFSENPELTYGILFGFLLTSIAMYFSGRLFTPLFSRVLRTPIDLLIPVVLLVSIIGVFAANYLFFEIWIALIVGVIAFFMRTLNYSLPAFVLAFVLGNIIESNFRQSMMVSGGDLSIFLTRPFSLAIVVLIIIIMLFSLRRKKK
ncbi:tripartite tricarboxylate transporter permease [Oceanobacillus jeddahense]|uniref:tripartite tricarboxylate transporter permease n=1 Tax=Oceanobacillus jeddahense TaxID=1462527 RepID=UPI000595EF5E|nr:tripartite tricarboxylate transporter permease [Oceanobacillus jeddahense]